MSMSDSSSLLPECHNVIDGGTNEYNEITLIQIHSLLTKTNLKLTIIETKNNSLEEIEKKITAFGQIRENLDNITSRVNKVELEIKTVKNDLGKLEANVSKLGDVFQRIPTRRKSPNSEVRCVSSGKKPVSGIIRSLMMLRHCLRPPPCNFQNSITDPKA